ncbi:MAG: hypothetical protein KKD31_18415 [Bacteroidetes bacterium]|nr:hypothetical protein [Bacteroidota bacterium]
MRAIEFKTRIKNNLILIPRKIQSKFRTDNDRNIRVIVLLDDNDVYEDVLFQQSSTSQFLKGYSDSDSIYDTY